MTLNEVKDFMYHYFYAVFKNKLPTLNICPYSSITAQMVGCHLLNIAPFFLFKNIFSLWFKYTGIGLELLSQARHNILIKNLSREAA